MCLGEYLMCSQKCQALFNVFCLIAKKIQLLTRRGIVQNSFLIWGYFMSYCSRYSTHHCTLVGDGTRMGDQPFCLQFPRLFGVTTAKNLPILTILGNNTSLSWDFTFCRNLSDIEIVDLESLLSLLSSVHLSPSVPDTKAWVSFSSRAFSINSFFLTLIQFLKFYPFLPC